MPDNYNKTLGADETLKQKWYEESVLNFVPASDVYPGQDRPEGEKPLSVSNFLKTVRPTKVEDLFPPKISSDRKKDVCFKDML